MSMNKIINDYERMVKEHSAEEAVKLIFQDISGTTDQAEKALKIEALIWLAVIALKRAFYAEAKFQASNKKLQEEVGL